MSNHVTTKIYFLTDRWSATLAERYDKLRREVPPGHRCEVLFQANAAPANLYGIGSSEFRTVPLQQVLEQPFAIRLRAMKGALIPGNLDQLFLTACLADPGYDAFWLVENDVVFSGSWQTFFDDFSSSPADLLGTSFHTRAFRPDWYHWPSFAPPQTVGDLPDEMTLRGFLPLMRLSQAAVYTLAYEYTLPWQGHTEAVLPTVLHNLGFTIEDLGGNNQFTKPDKLGKYYSNTLTRNQLSPGTFVYRPIMSEPGPGENKLWHPVKPLDAR